MWDLSPRSGLPGFRLWLRIGRVVQCSNRGPKATERRFWLLRWRLATRTSSPLELSTSSLRTIDRSSGLIFQEEIIRQADWTVFHINTASSKLLQEAQDQNQPIPRIRLQGRCDIKSRDSVALTDPFSKLNLSPIFWANWSRLQCLEVRPDIWEPTYYLRHDVLHLDSEATSIAQLMFSYLDPFEIFRFKMKSHNYDITSFREAYQPYARAWFLELEVLAKALPNLRIDLLIKKPLRIEYDVINPDHRVAHRLRFVFARENRRARIEFTRVEQNWELHWTNKRVWI